MVEKFNVQLKLNISKGTVVQLIIKLEWLHNTISTEILSLLTMT